MSNTVWYVTPLLDPTKRLEGPFVERDLALQRANSLVSMETRASLVMQVLAGRPLSKTGTTYTARPFSTDNIPAPIRIYKPPQEQHVNTHIQSLREKLFLLSRQKLLQLARLIELTIPPNLAHNKQALAAGIHKALLENTK